jgi:hypothetical protein
MSIKGICLVHDASLMHPTLADYTVVISLEPEFITPQDGSLKPDCENAAASLRLKKYAKRYKNMGATILGDDLYSCQP